MLSSAHQVDSEKTEYTVLDQNLGFAVHDTSIFPRLIAQTQCDVQQRLRLDSAGLLSFQSACKDETSPCLVPTCLSSGGDFAIRLKR